MYENTLATRIRIREIRSCHHNLDSVVEDKPGYLARQGGVAGAGCFRQSLRVALVRRIGHASYHPRRVLFPGNVVPRLNVALEGWKEVNCGSVTGPSAHSDSGDPNTVKWSNCGDEHTQASSRCDCLIARIITCVVIYQIW